MNLMNYLLKFSYQQGCREAMTKLGMANPEDEALKQLVVEQLTGDSLGAAGMGMASADDFVNFTEEDQTEDALNGNLDLQNTDEKNVHWGGKASLEGGDAGTRNEQLGLPRFNGV